ncbi:hypothetical protein L6164_016983 [Bauhinia variegata]|uniref:Uncharacterized protein n=1 Tax=Bauhinia variegata TaxID=167791 RepID=A0ACB9N809_BAUVA|nr:hypothetical protein L6164_016983 [Bauhinia variegata]
MTDFLALNYRSGDSSLSFGGDLNSLRAYFIVILHQYITSYRMVITCFSILPRVYAKTETYGTSSQHKFTETWKLVAMSFSLKSLHPEIDVAYNIDKPEQMYGRVGLCRDLNLTYSSLLNTISQNPILHFSTISMKTHLQNGHFVDCKKQFANLCSKGYIKEAFGRFISEVWAEPSLFSHLLQACIPRKSISLAKQLHSLIITSGCSADKFVSNHLLNLYSKLGDVQTAVVLFDQMPRRNTMSCNILINAYFQRGDCDKAIKLFDQMPERNVSTWNAIVAGLTQFEMNEVAVLIFKEMNDLGFKPDAFTLGSVLRGCAHLKALYLGWQVHAYVIKLGLELDLVVGSSLAHMYMKAGHLKDGEKVIKSMPIRNVVAWNTLIAGKAQNGYSEGVLDQYNMMKMSGFRPDKITFVSVLSSCSELATLGQGKQIHAEVIKAGADSVVAVISSLISSTISKMVCVLVEITGNTGSCVSISKMVLLLLRIFCAAIWVEGDLVMALYLRPHNDGPCIVTFIRKVLCSGNTTGMKILL